MGLKGELFDKIKDTIKALGEEYFSIRTRTCLHHFDHGFSRSVQYDDSGPLSLKLLQLFDMLWTVDHITQTFQWSFDMDVGDVRTELLREPGGIKIEVKPLLPQACLIGINFRAPNGQGFQLAYVSDGSAMFFVEPNVPA